MGTAGPLMNHLIDLMPGREFNTKRERFMSKTAKKVVFSLIGVFTTAAMLTAIGTAHARPLYGKTFIGKYDKVVEAKTAKCAICHPKPKDKAQRNNNGKAMGKVLGAKNLKDAAKVTEGLKKAEAEKSAVDGKTFGDLLKEGKLPASTE